MPGQGNLISFQTIETMDAPTLAAFMRTTLGKSLTDPRFGDLPDPTVGMELYCFMYSSLDFYGNLTTLSGAVAIPDGGSTKGMVIYTHGTSIGQHECPSSGITGPDAYAEAASAVAALTTGGYAVVMPDYIGQGASADPHPYVVPSRNAVAGRDAAVAAYAIASAVARPVANRIFVTGYSEGGANAMGLSQLLEASPFPDKPFVASAPLSGPYDLSGAQRLLLMGPQQPSPDDLQFAPLMLVGDVAHSANAYYGIKPGTIFKAAFAGAIAPNFSGKRTNKQAVESLLISATLAGYRKRADGDYYLADIMTPAAAAGLTTPDPNFPLYQVLQANDTFDWSPTVPMYLVGLKQDTLVSFGNTVSAVNAMRARGVTPATMNYHGIDGPDLNHLTASPGAMILARKFFDGGFATVPTD